MKPFRTLVFSPQAARLSRLLLHDPLFHLMDSTDGECDVFSMIQKNQPDLVILDDALPGTDMDRLMARLPKECIAPPRVLLLTEKEYEWDGPADETLSPAFPDAAFFHALHQAILPTLSRAGNQLVRPRFETAQALCQSLNVDTVLKGSTYMCLCAAWQSLMPTPASMGKLYDMLSDRLSVSPAAAERCIRTAIEFTWLHGDLTAISALFGNTVDAEKGKPTNAEFISLLAQHVKETALKQMREQE